MQRNLTVDEEASWVRKIASTTADCNMGGAYPTCPYHRCRLFSLMFIAGVRAHPCSYSNAWQHPSPCLLFVRSPGRENITSLSIRGQKQAMIVHAAVVVLDRCHMGQSGCGGLACSARCFLFGSVKTEEVVEATPSILQREASTERALSL